MTLIKNKQTPRQIVCRRYHRSKKGMATSRRFYVKNKLIIIERNAERKRKAGKILASIKNRPCMDCEGYFNPWQMDFDHREPCKKSFTIGRCTNYRIDKLLEEIKKCDVICSNCHRERTYNRLQENGNRRGGK